MANVPVVRTTFSHRDFARALILAWKRVVGVFPTKAQTGIIYAHYRLETGDGGFCWCFNIGNQKCTEAMASSGVPYMMLANTWEIVNGKKQVFQPPHPATWFRAYASLDEGVNMHLDSLHRRRYAKAWPMVESGDPHAFAVQLKADGYYTGFVEDYSRLMRVGFEKWLMEPAFDDAMADMEAILTADTLPALPVEPEPFPIVHPDVDFEPRDYSDDDKPPEAA